MTQLTGIEMNWLGDLCAKEIAETDNVLDLGCGIMQATLDTIDTYPPTRLKCRAIVGVDIHRPYLERIKDKEGVVVLNMGLDDLSMFLDKSFDVVMALDVVEHLEKKEALRVIGEMERISRRLVIVFTPEGWLDQGDLSKRTWGLGGEEYQRHKCYFTLDEFENMGFKAELRPGDNSHGKQFKTIFAVKWTTAHRKY